MNGQGRKPVKIDLKSLAERKVHYAFMYCIIVLYAKENTLLPTSYIEYRTCIGFASTDVMSDSLLKNGLTTPGHPDRQRNRILESSQITSGTIENLAHEVTRLPF